MGSTVFVFIAVSVLLITGGLLAFGYGIELILYCVEDNKWLWKNFWCSLIGLIFIVSASLAIFDMIKYQDKTKETEAKLEVYEKHLAKEEHRYDFKITLEDNSITTLHNAVGEWLNKDIIAFTMSDGSKIYFKDYKSIEEIPIK